VVQEPGAVAFGEIGGGMLEGRIEERRHQPQIRAESAKFLCEKELILADDAVMINLVQCLLPPAGLAAMVDGLEQWRHLGEAVGPMLRLRLHPAFHASSRSSRNRAPKCSRTSGCASSSSGA